MKKLQNWLPDIFAVGGIGCIVGALWQVSPIAGMFTLGVTGLCAAVIFAMLRDGGDNP